MLIEIILQLEAVQNLAYLLIDKNARKHNITNFNMCDLD